MTEVPATSGTLDNYHQRQNEIDTADCSRSVGRVFVYPCRCGSQYTLCEADLSDSADSIVVGCAGCSLHVRVTYSPVDDTTP